MKTAIVAVTRQGVELAEKTAALLAENGGYETVVYVPGKFSLLQIDGRRRPYRKSLRELCGELFAEYEGIVCIMALGIVVRLIAPHLRGKTEDPAVVVMDELGQNVISVLAGHWGGANALTGRIAELCGANPVITTATDVHGLPAVEMLARERGWRIEPFELVRKINAAIVNGQKVVIYSDIPLNIKQAEHIEVQAYNRYAAGQKEDRRVVLVTNKAAEHFPPGTLFLRPPNLCIGVGCRRGVSDREVLAAITAAMAEAGLAMSCVRSLASIDIKSDEAGLLAAAGELARPVQFFSRPELLAVLRERDGELTYSEFVDDKIGVGGVCEPAAILGAGKTPELVQGKRKYGQVTIAIAAGDWR